MAHRKKPRRKAYKPDERTAEERGAIVFGALYRRSHAPIPAKAVVKKTALMFEAKARITKGEGTFEDLRLLVREANVALCLISAGVGEEFQDVADRAAVALAECEMRRVASGSISLSGDESVAVAELISIREGQLRADGYVESMEYQAFDRVAELLAAREVYRVDAVQGERA